MIEKVVEPRGKVHFDVTFALRHLPLLTLFAALAIRTLKEAEIEGIWYGALELRDKGIAPALNLNGLLDIVGWTTAKTILDRTGDVSSFGPLIDEGGGHDLSRELRKAAFRERVAGPDEARDDVLKALERLAEVEEGVAALFRPAIEEQFAWARNPERAGEGHDLADRVLEKGNEVRAVTLGFEAVISRAAAAIFPKDQLPKNTTVFQRRFGNACETCKDPAAREFISAYLRLKELRNTIVHVKKTIDPALNEPDVLHKELRGLFAIMKRAIPEKILAATREDLERAKRKSLETSK